MMLSGSEQNADAGQSLWDLLNAGVSGYFGVKQAKAQDRTIQNTIQNAAAANAAKAAQQATTIKWVITAVGLGTLAALFFKKEKLI